MIVAYTVFCTSPGCGYEDRGEVEVPTSSSYDITTLALVCPTCGPLELSVDRPYPDSPAVARRQSAKGYTPLRGRPTTVNR